MVELEGSNRERSLDMVVVVVAGLLRKLLGKGGRGANAPARVLLLLPPPPTLLVPLEKGVADDDAVEPPLPLGLLVVP